LQFGSAAKRDKERHECHSRLSKPTLAPIEDFFLPRTH
jgi:hypothetical protein